jgi:hypothetical protein
MEAADNPLIVENSSYIPDSALRKLDSYWDEVEKMPVPEIIPNIDLNNFPENHRIDMFNLARDAWEDTYNPAELISKMREDGESTGERKDLKNLRKNGLVLRAAYKSLDGRHLAPQKHWLFLKLLGDLNDTYYSPQRAESKVRLADFVEKQYMSLDGLEFFSATNKSFQDNYNKELALVNKLNNEDILPAHDFHLMRKLLRNSMNTFRLSGTLTHDPETTQVARYMQHLNETLGEKQDHLVQQDIRGELAYGDAIVVIPPDEKRKIQGFVQANI